MRKVVYFFPLAFVATSMLTACSFSLRAGSDPKEPKKTAKPAQATPPPAATPATAVAKAPSHTLGRRPAGQPAGPTPTPSSSASTAPSSSASTSPLPSILGISVVNAATPFGDGTADAAAFKGSLYWVDKGTTQIPPLANLKPAGVLFAKEINVTPQAFTTGFPGVDAARKENFAIRYEAPLVVSTEADYDFRLVADDGAKLLIDNTPIVDNDGVKTAPAEKTGPVHLVAGTHLITVDYLQTTGNVALQVYCKKANDVEKLCPTKL